MHVQRNQALIMGLVLTGAATVGLLLHFRADPSTASGSLQDSSYAPPGIAGSEQSGASASHRNDDIERLVSRRSTFSLDRTKLQAALSKKAVLQLADPDKVIAGSLRPSAKQISDGRQFIAYDPYVIESKAVGDDIEIYLPNIGLTAHGVIDNIEVNGDIIRWSGRFEDFNSTQSSFSISQTMIDQYVLGVFETPMGTFNLEAKNGLGWIVDQGTDFHLPADGKDYVESKGKR
ncbi:hypothetical protein GLA29479_593 [Lysobacter antibioticus]|jgi:hypothetical protein|uniref:Uncharacterized protein n=1 Tax=Lysobacter antibioticus TaxID=84531 RepID=A0A0S2F8H3_LYSAN|nr:metalloprotease secretion chaperone CpaB [Lysobacter antibioticus]ALN61478.1 hypothetical protein GLA29479_593 [Lysobacter antibioticus]ALN79830.1 hypothetical protein LA76x_1674 [Lysobacter antibioticus]